MTPRHGEQEGTIIDSILQSIKQLLGMDKNYNQFDPELIIHINSAIGELTSLGIGVEDGYFITGSEEVWSVFMPRDARLDVERAKMYVYFKVRLSFDPPTTSFLLDSMDRQIKELEWKLAK